MNKHDFPRKFDDLTPAQIAYLTGEYHAINGHIMEMPLRVTSQGDWWQTSAQASCTGECHRRGACAEGMPLEDW